MQKNTIKKILIAGEGGQGAQTIAKILQRASFLSGEKSLYVPNFGVEQRGGVTMAYLQISDANVFYPKFSKASIAVLLSPRSVDRAKEHIDENTDVVVNLSLITAFDEQVKSVTKIDATNIALEKFSPKVFSAVVLGMIKKYFNYSDDVLEQAMEEELGSKFSKDEDLKKENFRALHLNIQTA
ncbi:ketoisovalerate oxidoreductase [bacterium]|nr:MAG: ketoisovalerate oxidoreductase [bacterium]